MTTTSTPLRGLPTPLDERPMLAIWELTQACDLVCAHCRACATTERNPLELSTAEGKALLGRLAEIGVPMCVLTGGDPTKREDLIELVAYGNQAGLRMAVTPSGTEAMTPEILAGLKQAGLCRLAVSIDGPDATSHDSFRGVAGSFEQSLRILRQARELGIPTQLNVSVGPHNHNALGAMVELTKSVGAVLLSVFFVVPLGRATSLMSLRADRVEAILEQLADFAEKAPFDIKTTAAPHYRRILLSRHASRRTIGLLDDLDEEGCVKGPRGINDGVGFLFVSHQGDVYPSGFLPLSAGNIRQDDVAALYRNSVLFRDLRDPDALHGKCGVCAFRRVCGGSRARAYATSGDVMGEDPLCAYQPKGHSKAKPQDAPHGDHHA